MTPNQTWELKKLPSHSERGGPIEGVIVVFEDGTRFMLNRDHPLIKSITEGPERKK